MKRVSLDTDQTEETNEEEDFKAFEANENKELINGEKSFEKMKESENTYGDDNAQYEEMENESIDKEVKVHGGPNMNSSVMTLNFSLREESMAGSQFFVARNDVHVALHRIGREKWGSGQDGGFAFEVDSPNEVAGRVGGKEEAVARGEVISSEGRGGAVEGGMGVDDGEEAAVEMVEGEANEGGARGEEEGGGYNGVDDGGVGEGEEGAVVADDGQKSMVQMVRPAQRISLVLKHNNGSLGRVSDIVLRFELAPEASWFSERLETGHIKKYCPQLRNKTANSNSSSRDLKEKKFKSRKALLTWDDSDESDKEGSEDEDVAQLGFMANDDDLKHNDIWLWHRRLGHVHMDLIKKLLSKDLVRGLPNLREFEMSMMGELTFFLGLQIKQSKDGIFINQSKYTRELLKRFGLENAKPRGTPISPSVNLIKDENGKDVDSKLFRGMIGSLLYLTASRPDIMFSVCICARFQACPKESHLSAVKRIFKYLSGTLNLGLWYPRNSSIDLVGFSDSDYAGCLVDRKSTSGTCQFLGDALVSWHSKKQTSVALSTAEAEYVAAGSCCAQVLWMRQTLQDFGVSLALIPIMCDSSSAIDIRRVSDIVLRFELAPEASWFSERLE
ncbi:hypothetical protein RJ640_020402 [Escallonia rubra]|uniref:GAG-pre-integrase domain-containing protein n=1 Tax=Escallonia rubra TaxID=112253 RepID=A0AA88QNI1_9ASTE|nr:hypothetical protein RJ640_020402 [Escallonia rubra]